jgi:hypothetical protein
MHERGFVAGEIDDRMGDGVGTPLRPGVPASSFQPDQGGGGVTRTACGHDARRCAIDSYMAGPNSAAPALGRVSIATFVDLESAKIAR